ncbi:tyrosine-type recombinase/integrase [Bacillus dakarensis]|uniref:tyrosine-type recombinase/integrase n=1 Tax=Robertmurraya dakarensis TaxID=1926278 RepID=UPI000981E7A4|nr:tyrosine-type recombinase/integrase [Bacillus dakarensis]
MKDKEKQFIFDGPFKDYCSMYVEYKRNLGYKFGESSLYQLRYMNDFFKKYDMVTLKLNKEMVEDYVSKRGKESAKTQHMRMSLIRQFAIYMNSMGFDFYVHPKELIPISKTFSPYIFTREEIASIIKVVDNLKYIPSSKYYHVIYPMLFRMLYGCGLRINEALSLKKVDVDLDGGILTVKKAKNNTSRLVPMSTSLTNYCRRYVSKMGFDMHEDGYFYPSRDNGKYNNTPVYVKFKDFMKEAGIFAENEVGPRVHDIRHTFAVHALEKMVQDGQDLYCALPILCTYLGHRDIESTEKYLRLTEEAYGQIIDSVTPLYNGVFPEVQIDE